MDIANIINDEVIESFFKCKYKAYLKFTNANGAETEYAVTERQFLTLYKNKFYNNIQAKPDVQILSNTDFRSSNHFDKTTYVFDFTLQLRAFDIRFDALKITPAYQSPTYEPIFITLREKVTKSEKLMVAIKCLIARQRRKFSIEFAQLLCGRKLRGTKIKIETYAKEAQRSLKELLKLVKHEEPPRCYHNSHCKICEFCEMCRTELVAQDDLSLLGRISEKEVGKYNRRGLFTINQLSYTFRAGRKKREPSKLPRFSWELKALALRETKTYIREIPAIDGKGVEVHLDFEGLLDENFVYLIGLLIKDDSSERTLSFWADSAEDEAEIFKQLFVVLAALKDFVIYHYGSYEPRNIKRVGKQLGEPYETECLKLCEQSVNILSFFTSVIYPPTYTNELKEIANFLGFQWSYPRVSGIYSVIWRKQWELTRDTEYKDRLLQYNLEDCKALEVTKNWIAEIGRRIERKNADDVVQTITVKDPKRDSYKWGSFKSPVADFEKVNKYAYFNYQREKVYVRTSKYVKKALKRKTKQLKLANKVNKVEVITIDQCPFCRSRDIYPKYKLKKTIIDLKFSESGVKKWVVHFKSALFKCRHCRKTFKPKRYKVLPDLTYGHNVVVWIVNQHVTYRISLQKIADILLETFNIHIIGSVMSIYKARLAGEYTATYEQLQQKLIHGDLLQVDETPTPLGNSASGYVWVFTSIDAVFYLLKPNREAEFLKDLLREFTGVLVSDFYPGYDSLPCLQQKCLIHLMRDLNSDFYKNQINDELRTVVFGFGQLLRMIVQTIDKYGLTKQHLHKHLKDVDTFYRQNIMKDYETDLAISWRKRFVKNRDKLFTFLDHDGIPWNNNNAEVAIKAFADYRKVGKEFFTEKSMKEYLVLFSIQQTCRYREIGFLDFLRSGEKDIEHYSNNYL